MPITVSGQLLKRVLTAMKPYAPHLGAVPSVRLYRCEGGLRVEVASDPVCARVDLPCEGEATFDVFLPVAALARSVRPAKKRDRATLAAEDGNNLRVTLGGASTLLLSSRQGEPPPYVTVADGAEYLATFTLDLAAWGYVLPAMSVDDTRPQIQVLHFVPARGGGMPAFVVGTDGHRIHMADTPGAQVVRPFSLWRDAALLVSKLQKILGGVSVAVHRSDATDEEVDPKVRKDTLRVRSAAWEVCCTTVWHKFPDYTRVVPKLADLPTELTIPVAKIRAALRALPDSLAVKVTTVDNTLTLACSNYAAGAKASATVPLNARVGPDAPAVVNPHYLAQVFSVPGDTATWQLPAPGEVYDGWVADATKILSQDGSCRAVLMPMRP